MDNSEIDLNKLWKTALGELEVVLSKATFTTWFRRTVLDSVQDGIYTVGVPNFFYKDWLLKNQLSAITKALTGAVGEEPKQVKIKVVSEEKFLKPETKDKKVIHRPVDNFPVKEVEKIAEVQTLEVFNNYQFNNFVVGPNNRLAHAAAVAVAEKPGRAYNPLFIYGPSGLGKTHLLRAIETEIRRKNPKMKILYLSSETFTNDYINALQSNSISAFRKRHRDNDVLIYDDIQFIGGKEMTQEEFFHTFNHLHQNNKQVVLASDRVPRAIKGLEDRLVTRFEWGMMADIGMPDLETRSAILLEKCAEKNINLPPDIIELIAQRVTTSIRELEGILNKIIAETEINKKVLSIAMVESILGQNNLAQKSNQSNSPAKIIKTICDFYNIKRDDLFGSKRNREIVRPRQFCMYLLRSEANLSYLDIAKEMGGKDHTTIMYGCKCIEKSLASDAEIKTELNLLKERIRAS